MVLNTTTTQPTTPSPLAEPGPDWPVARLQWGAAWELHWIGLGIAFALIAVHSLAALLMADKSKAFARRPLFFAVNFLLVIMGTVRAIFLWIDPYESTQNGLQVNLWVNKVLFGIAFPCLTSAFCLIHVALLEVSKIKLGSKKLHSIPFVSSIIVLHFIIVLVAEITVAFKANMTELLIVCQSFFIIWGFANSFAFLYSGGRVIHRSRLTRKEMSQISQHDSSNNDRARKGATTKVAKITMITAILGFACCALQIYSIVGVYGLYSKVVNPEPWPCQNTKVLPSQLEINMNDTSTAFSNISSSPTINGPAPEPGPDWPVARLQWGAAWELHWIGLGIAFALIAVHSLAALLMADKSKAFARRPLFFAVNFLLVIMGTVRTIFLWVDPYESTENGLQVSSWVNRVLFGIAFPCLTSAFCLIHVVFLEVSKIKLGSKKLHSIPFVSSIIVLHFIIVLVSDITVAFKANMTELLIVCQSFFIIWGFANSFAFLYSGGRVIHSSRRTRKEMSQISQQDSSNNDRARKGATTKVAKIMMITAILGFACCALQIYSIVGVYGLYSKVVNPEPWPW
ncbi:hypothetical protein QZH41_000702 [Actinostola sp. cb2023]|nr:hypothetical protein QZH41_000702 [Actinostola sp. cb2023]